MDNTHVRTIAGCIQLHKHKQCNRKCDAPLLKLPEAQIGVEHIFFKHIISYIRAQTPFKAHYL